MRLHIDNGRPLFVSVKEVGVVMFEKTEWVDTKWFVKFLGSKLSAMTEFLDAGAGV